MEQFVFCTLKKKTLEFLLCRSMLPDVVDDFKVKNPGVHGHEALFYSFFVFFVKFASGVSLGISTLSLKYVYSCHASFVFLTNTSVM